MRRYDEKLLAWVSYIFPFSLLKNVDFHEINEKFINNEEKVVKVGSGSIIKPI